MTEKTPLSEIELGIRELFRILAPGAYALILIQAFWEGSSLASLLAASTTMGITGAFFLGLIGYALRAHETCYPYSISFERGRSQLNTAINKILQTNKSDNVNLYKYFLETKALNLKDRIHYFSSFYYMLVELSLFSLITALAVAASCMRDVLSQSSVAPWFVCFPIALFFLAAVIQASLLGQLRGIPTGWKAPIARTPLILVGVAFLVQFGHTWYARVLSEYAKEKHAAFAVLVLLAVAFAFERLAAKQWLAITHEQIVLVLDKQAELREIGNRVTE